MEVKKHLIEINFSQGFIINGQVEKKFFEETLVKHNIQKDDFVKIKHGEQVVDIPFAQETYELMISLGYQNIIFNTS